MKLKSENYTSPNPQQGEFKNVFIEDTVITHKRHEKYLSIQFDMYYLKGTEKIILDTKTLGFLGTEDDEVSSNETTIVSVLNPEYNPEIEGSEETITVPLFDPKGGFNIDPTKPFSVVDYGFPTYEKVLSFFQGGTFENPEITITEQLAIGFILSKLIMNGEPVGKQFTFQNE
jgi:hypothetical protein